ncbi:type VI secretion system protein ImpL [Burkholderia ubonensis]|uniref:type VI secretion protein IcmF/TssM N-terminal domain-containing protein n=1 Tax=Burkholderia ubonensis TaxID=101571 RepID=UPI0007554F2F|nr:type VI secretion protein IcmF/TssM N-terminal domain-containing protein [Burkholderia ubonensis]KVP81048.1 type VI secretion system protein ImpL [Burkholderia ubonensis]
MKTLGKIFACFVALLALAAVSWATTLYFDWPLWSAPAVFCTVLTGWLLFRFTRRALRAVRARRQLARLDVSEHLSGDREIPERRVTARWQAALGELEQAAPAPGLLGGRPRDALPWYLVIGRSSSGKTTALARARVASPLRRARRDTPVEPTEDCDWWCFDDAVVLDLAGRFAEPDATDADRHEWSAILDQLGSARARKGINGVVVAIDVPRLVEADRDALTIDGCAVRERLEHLIRLFDRRFPVYVLVTQCDRLYGFEEWAAQLAPEDRERAFGYLGDHDTNAFISHAFESVAAHLSALRTAQMMRDEPPSPRALMLPQELERVRPALDVFAHAAFGPNAYQETPYLRGLLFTSGRQSGGARSLTLPDWLDTAPVCPVDGAGLFLYDVFARVLPGDRDASRPVERPRRSRLTLRRLGLTVWLLACVTAGLLMTDSFIDDRQTVELIRHDYPAHPRFAGDPEGDARMLERIGRVIAEVDRYNERLFLRQMADATPVGRLAADLKVRYVARYRQSIEPFADRLFFGESDSTDVALRIRNLVHYVNLMQARQHGADRATLALMSAPMIICAPDNGACDHGDGLSPRLTALAVSHVAWSTPDDSALAARIAAAQVQLERLAYRDPNGAWLLDLPDAATPHDVTLSDFWPTAAARALPPALRDVRVPGALTAAHRPVIDAFLDDMALAVANRPKFAFHRGAFDAWYSAQRVDTWRDFVERFPQGAQLLTTEAQWRSVVDRIPGHRDPFALLLTHVAREFESAHDDALPPWLRFVRTVSRMLASARTPATDGSLGSMLGTISRSGGQALRETLGGAPSQARLTLERDAALLPALIGYERHIAALAVDALAGPGAAYRLAADFHGFGANPSVESSAMRAADDALREVKRLAGDRDVGGDVIWSLVGGPMHTVFAYVEQQASCALQSAWERDVLWPLRRAATRGDANDRLFGPQGAIWTFADGPAKPFVRLGAARASAVDTLGYRLPFSDSFLPMLDEAAARRVAQAQRDVERRSRQQMAVELDEQIASRGRQIDVLRAQTIRLEIVALPTDVNPDAQAKPFETTLTLQCAPQARTLKNYNFRVSEQIDWRPDQCGDATLRIELGGITLMRRYAGPLGVARFVQDFRYGVRRFVPRDFPEAKARLERLGVRYVDVRYDFSGQDRLLAHVAEIDALERARRDDIARRRQIAIRQSDEAGANIADPSTRQPGSTADTALPRRIGACWGNPSRDDSY